MNKFCGALLLFLLMNCALFQYKGDISNFKPANTQMSQDFEKAKLQLAQKNYLAAVKTFRRLALEASGQLFREICQLYVARIYIEIKRIPDAKALLTQLIALSENREIVGYARLYQATIAYRFKQYQEALLILSDLEQHSVAQIRLKALDLKLECGVSSKRWELALKAAIRLYSAVEDPLEKRYAREWIGQIIMTASRSKVGKLFQILKDEEPLFSQVVKNILIQFQARNQIGEARWLVQSVLKLTIPPGVKKGLETYFHKAFRIDSGYAIGCLIPLSGKYSRVGTQMLKALFYSISDILKQESKMPVRLIVRDCGNPQVSFPRLIKDLVEQEGVVALIGPSGQELAVLAAKAAQVSRIPIIVYSMNRSIAKDRAYVHNYFYFLDWQLQAVTRYLKAQLQVNRVAILYPNTRTGQVFSRLIATALSKESLQVVAKIPYFRRHDSIKKAILQLKTAQFEALFLPETDLLKGVSLVLPTLAAENLWALSPSRFLRKKSDSEPKKGLFVIGLRNWLDKNFISDNAQFVKGVLLPVLYPPRPETKNPAILDYLKRFEPEWASYLDIFLFDSLLLYTTLFKKGIVEPEQILKGLRQGGIIGITGPIEFDASRNRKDFTCVGEILDSDVEIIYPPAK